MNAEDDLRPPDVYEINEALNKNRRKDDQIKEVPSSIEDYQDEERARRLAETYAEVKKILISLVTNQRLINGL